MSKYTLYDLDLPSEFPQHSELNIGLSLYDADLHLTRDNPAGTIRWINVEI